MASRASLLWLLDSCPSDDRGLFLPGVVCSEPLEVPFPVVAVLFGL